MKEESLSKARRKWVIFEDGTTSMEVGNVTLRPLGKKALEEVDVSELSDKDVVDLLENVRTRKLDRVGKHLRIRKKLATTKHSLVDKKPI